MYIGEDIFAPPPPPRKKKCQFAVKFGKQIDFFFFLNLQIETFHVLESWLSFFRGLLQNPVSHIFKEFACHHSWGSPEASNSQIDFKKNFGDISTILDVSKFFEKNFGLNKPKSQFWKFDFKNFWNLFFQNWFFGFKKFWKFFLRHRV